MKITNALALRLRRKRRQDMSALKELITTPGDLTTGVVLPANAELYMSTSSVLVAATVLMDVGARGVGCPDGAANAKHCIGWFEKGRTLEKAATAVGTVSVYASDDLGNLSLIAQG